MQWAHALTSLILVNFMPSAHAALQRDAPVYLEIITVRTQADLDRILGFLQSGQEFSELAQKYSTHPTSRTGGIWGPLRMEELQGVIRDQVEKAREGSLVHFFDRMLGFTIFRKLDPASARKILFQQTLNRGASHLQRNEKDEAVRELRNAVALDPQSSAAHQLLGQGYLALGTYEMLSEAKAEFVQALALDPNLVWSKFYLARIYLDLGFPLKAKDQLESALKLGPRIPHLLSLLGEANRKLGNLPLSVELNRKALEIDPPFFIAHYYLGLAYLDLKKEEEGIAELEAAVKPGYPSPEIYLALGKEYLRRGELERSTALCRKAVEAAPDNPEAHLRLAQTYRLKKQPDLALIELSRSEPGGKSFFATPFYQQLQTEVFFERGLVYQEKGSLSMAVEAYSKVLDLDPNNGKAHNQLAAVLFRKGEYALSLEHAAKAQELNAPVEPSLLEKIKAKRRPEK